MVVAVVFQHTTSRWLSGTRRCHEDGLLVLTAGSYGNVLRFLPPLSISDALLREGVTVLEEAIAKELASIE